jgi:NADH dehydrogenase
MTILITGATGFVGRSLVRALERENRPMRLLRSDINDFEAVREALQGVETVIHLAGGEARGRPHWLAYVDIEGTATLVRALRYRPVRRILTLSRLHAATSAVFPLLQAKGLLEQTLRQSGIPFTILRSATLFGVGDRFTNSIAFSAARTWPVAWLPGGGEALMQPLWVEDVVRCLVQALDRDDLLNAAVDLFGAERLHYREVVQRVLIAADLRRRSLALPMIVARQLNALGAWVWRYPPRNEFDFDRFSTPEVGPLDTVSSLFGFRPAPLHDHLAHLRQGGWRRQLRR